MSDSENPFAGGGKNNFQPPDRSTVAAWAVAVAAVMAALFCLMLWSEGKSGKQRELENLRAQLATANAGLDAANSENQTNRDFIANLQTQVGDLQKERDMAGLAAKNLENEMRADLESKDVTISNLQGRLTVTIVDRVMFDSGEAVLKPDGAAVMQKIAGLLAAHTALKIQVVGHTDNVPIRPSAQSRFASNWELSTARALAAVHFLTERAGVDPRRLSAAGCGEFRPVADNATAEGRAKNRRIAIAILPDELPVANQPTTGRAEKNSASHAADGATPEQ
jgi:chemotaxis protein MotB